MILTLKLSLFILVVPGIELRPYVYKAGIRPWPASLPLELILRSHRVKVVDVLP